MEGQQESLTFPSTPRNSLLGFSDFFNSLGIWLLQFFIKSGTCTMYWINAVSGLITFTLLPLPVHLMG